MFDLMPFGRGGNDLFSYLDNVEKNFFGNLTFAQFRTDVIDKGGSYELQAELPGFQKDDINIDLNGDTLTIRAEHKDEKENQNENYVYRERKYGSFSRSFDVSGIQQEAIAAEYSDGILHLNLPKKVPTPPAIPEKRQIEIK